MKFVIVGGGITGWLSALVFSEKQPFHEYVVVESSDINTIGVGEGYAWPYDGGTKQKDFEELRTLRRTRGTLTE